MSADITPQDSESPAQQSASRTDGEAEGHGYLPREERGGQSGESTVSALPLDDGEAEGHLRMR